MATSTGRKPATGPWSTPCTGAAPMSSKIECTAVNELSDLVQQKPLDRDSAAELLFQPPREANLRRQVDGTPAPRSLWAVAFLVLSVVCALLLLFLVCGLLFVLL